MKRSIILAALLTLVLAAMASSGEPFMNCPPIYPGGNGSVCHICIGFDGDMALDGAVDYGVGTGPRGVFGPPSASETDGVVGYGVGSGPHIVIGSPSKIETDGVVDYGVGSGPKTPAQGKTN